MKADHRSNDIQAAIWLATTLILYAVHSPGWMQVMTLTFLTLCSITSILGAILMYLERKERRAKW